MQAQAWNIGIFFCMHLYYLLRTSFPWERNEHLSKQTPRLDHRRAESNWSNKPEITCRRLFCSSRTMVCQDHPGRRTRSGVVVDCPGVWTQKIAFLWSFGRGKEKSLLNMTYNPKVLLTIKPRLWQKIFQFCMHSVLDLPDHNVPPTIQAHKWSNIDHLKLVIWSSYNISKNYSPCSFGFVKHLILDLTVWGQKNTQESLLT